MNLFIYDGLYEKPMRTISFSLFIYASFSCRVYKNDVNNSFCFIHTNIHNIWNKTFVILKI